MAQVTRTELKIDSTSGKMFIRFYKNRIFQTRKF